MNEHSGWNSKLTFVFAMIGATIGIGNIWRFSYVFYTNGGGSFFIPYIIAILVMGIPFLILENGLGFKYKESFSKLLHDINPKFEIIAWMLVLFVFIVAIYYMVILSWDFIYLMNSFTFGWGNDPSKFFVTNVGGSSDFANIGSIILPTFIGIIILWALLWIVSNNDVDKGIGRISKVLMPMLFIIMSFILFYSFTLPGFELGLKTLLAPNWNALSIIILLFILIIYVNNVNRLGNDIMENFENQKFCQSCAMPMTEELFGTNADGSKNEDYCMYCFKDGEFTSDMTMEEMMNFCIEKMIEVHPEIDRDEASKMMNEVFPQLKRWAKD